jgi:hypothetical protein
VTDPDRSDDEGDDPDGSREDGSDDGSHEGASDGSPDRLFPESEPVEDPTEFGTSPPAEDPMDSFDRPTDADRERQPGRSPTDEPSTADGSSRGGDESHPRRESGETDDEVGDLFQGEPDDADTETASDGPLGDLADRMREQREAADGAEDLFEEVEVGAVDEETLWKQVAADEGFAVEPPVEREDVIEKSAYCEKCEFFTGPPRTRCTHEGTTILELADLEHFRVRNCPVVLEEEALENIND